MTLLSNVTLSVQPGVVVKFHPNTGIQVDQGATLSAIGTSGARIHFTSIKDDTVGGDTNNDGGLTLPNPGDWGSISVAASFSGEPSTGTINLDFANVRYGGGITLGGAANINNSILERSSGSSIYVYRDENSNPTVTIQNSTIRNNNSTGISIFGTAPTITGNTFNNNNLNNSNSAALQLDDSQATITNNTFNNQARAIVISSSGSATSPTISGNTISRGGATKNGQGIESNNSTPNLTNNTISGFGYPVKITNGYPQRVPTYSGNSFNNNQITAVGVEGTLTNGTWTSFGGYLHTISGGAYLPSGTTLTVPAGTILKFGDYQGFHTCCAGLSIDQNATLNAIGSSGNSIFFTSIQDDVGGDTNNDGGITLPAAGNWGNISVAASNQFNSTVGTLNLDYVTVRYGGGWCCSQAMLYIGGAASINHSTIERSANTAVYIYRDENSTPSVTIQNSTIRNNSFVGISIFGTDPTITSNTFNNNNLNNNNSPSLDLSDSQATISNNTFNNQARAIAITSSNAAMSPTISGNSVTRGGATKNGQGIESNNSTPNLTNNTISGFGYPVKVTNGYPQRVPTYSGNTFNNNQISAVGVEGTLTNGTWTAFGGYLHTIAAGANLPSGTTLTIPAGTVLKFGDFQGFYQCCAGLSIEQNATLNAIGTAGNPIYFTSIQDDVGGDTNNDGSANLPATGNWSGVSVAASNQFNATVGTLNLDYVTVRYGSGACCFFGMLNLGGAASINHSTIERSGVSIYVYHDENSDPSVIIQNSTIRTSDRGIYANGANPSISNNTFNNNSTVAIELNDSQSAVSNNTFNNNPKGISVSSTGGAMSPSISGNTISRGGSSKDGHGIESNNSTPNLTNNTVSGFGYPVKVTNGYPQRVPSYSGNSFTNNQVSAIGISGQLTNGTWTSFGGYLHTISGSANLPSGTTLTIPAGTVLKFGDFQGFYQCCAGLSIEQNATLNAIGTSGNPIFFTSIQDDVGGDTNNDGSTTSPAPGNWGNISVAASNQFNSTVGTLNLDYVTVRYGGGWCCSQAMLYIGGAASINHSTIEHSASTGIYLYHDENSDPSVSVQNSTIRNHNTGVAVAGSDVSLQGNSIYGSASFGVSNLYGSPVVDARNVWWGDDSGPAHSSNPLGTGNAVSDGVLFDPWVGKSAFQARNASPSTYWTKATKDPVNVVFGNFTYQYTDLAVPGNGLGFSFERTYNSAITTASVPLGYGWTHNFNMSVLNQTVGTDSTALVSYADGRTDRYFSNNDGTYTAPPGTFDTLTFNGSVYTLTQKDRIRYIFNNSGLLTSIVDKNGNTLTLSYTGTLLNGITDTAGRSFTFTLDGIGRITKLTDPLGRNVMFAYDVNGDLVTSTDARGKTTTYGYDANHRITSITDANGHTFVQNTYNADGRVIEQRDAKLNLTLLDYDLTNRVTVVTDARGNPTTYTYDAEARVVSEMDALNDTVSYVYDDNNNLTQITDRRGYPTQYEYDARGNTTKITDADSKVWIMTYDSHNNLLTKTDPLGRVTTNTYDANDNLETTTTPAGTTTFTYNAKGLVASITDANNHATIYGYNPNGDRNSTTDAESNTTTASYDAGGRKLSQTDPLNHTTVFTYNPNNNLVTITDAMTHVTTYDYDNVGNRISVTDANNKVTNFAYDERDQLATVTDAEGGIVTYEYDEVRNKTQMTDANNHITLYTYNAVNRLETATDPEGKTTNYGYDANGNKISILDANGQTTTFSYDALNRLSQIQYPSSSANFGYDAVSNRTSMSDSTGTTIYSFDDMNRLTQVQSPGYTVEYGYDNVGNRTSITYPNTDVASFTYDDANRLETVTDWDNRTFTYTYDAASNRTQLDNPNGTYTTYTYDDANRLTDLTTKDASDVTLFTASYTLDDVGNRMQMIDTEGTTDYDYDDLYRLTDVTYPDASSTEYTYDAMGNRSTLIDGDGTTNYGYDDADRLLAAGALSFSWDDNGNQLSKGSTTYQYDTANRLTQVVNVGTTVDFSYDGDGKRTTRTVNGTPTSYVYDVGASLPLVLTETTAGNTTTYLFGNDLLVQYDNAGTPTYYHVDGLGSVRAMTDDGSAAVAMYNYDVFGAVRNSSGAASNFKFAGEQADEEVGLIYLRARYYDENIGRFTANDPWRGLETDNQSLNKYVYARSNPTNFTDPSGLAYTYAQVNAGGFYYIGASADAAIYVDPNTGKGAIVYSGGGGIGLGGGVAGEVGISQSIPGQGFSVSSKISGLHGTLKGSTSLDLASQNIGGGFNTGTELSAAATLRYTWIGVSWESWDDFHRKAVREPFLLDALNSVSSSSGNRNTRGATGGSWGGPPSQGK